MFFGLRYAAAAANLLFLTAAIYLGVTAFYKTVTARIESEDTARFDAPATVAPASESGQPLAHYEAIAGRNLFQTGDDSEPVAAPEPEEETPPPSELQETRLQLKLWGTVTGDDDRAYAVIEEGRKREQNLFRTGDTLEGATVKKILREKVILSVNGQDEVLSMEDIPGTGGPAVAAYTPTPEPSAAGTPFENAAGGSQQVNLQRAEVDEAMNNVNSLMRQARIRPHFRNGKPDGLTLSRVRRDSIFTRLGLRSGDIITGVDGQPIESVDDALKFYNSLKSSSNLNLQIRRRGQSQTLQYTIE